MARLQQLVLLVTTLALALVVDPARAGIPVRGGYAAMSLDPLVELAFVAVVAQPALYSEYVGKRMCIFSVDSAWKAAYTPAQFDFRVTGCDVREGLGKLKKLASRAAVNAELGRCSSTMKTVCTPISASIEVVDKSPWQISYITYDSA